jgi:hypothetical protein
VPAIDFAALPVRDLLYAAIDEATAATNGHIGTLETTFALLQTITAFSGTVEVLKREIQDRKRARETKLVELERFDEAVEGMRLLGMQERLEKTRRMCQTVVRVRNIKAVATEIFCDRFICNDYSWQRQRGRSIRFEACFKLLLIIHCLVFQLHTIVTTTFEHCTGSAVIQ